MNIEKTLKNRAKGIQIERDIPLSDLTTLRVGGPAAYLAKVRRAEDAMAIQQTALEYDLPLLVLGNGSNLLIGDAGFPGIVMLMKNNDFSGVCVWGDILSAQGGASMAALAQLAAQEGMTGLECIGGIPGTVGGGIYMNAGAYGGEIGSAVESVIVLKEGEIDSLTREEMAFSYRHSRAMEEGLLVLGAEFRLQKGDKQEIVDKMKELNAKRREKQPLEYPSAGSFFKRPEGYFAGALIEQSNLKGVSVGGAQVSEKHAGFLINRGGATAQDFLDLMHLVQQRVFADHGVRLEPEVRIIGGEA